MGRDLYARDNGEREEEAKVMREADLRDTIVVLGSLVLAISIVWWILLLP